jgi:hypothetical protein
MPLRRVALRQKVRWIASPYLRSGFGVCDVEGSGRQDRASLDRTEGYRVALPLSQASLPLTALRLKEKRWTSFSGLSLVN